jgi:hypothetical protein
LCAVAGEARQLRPAAQNALLHLPAPADNAAMNELPKRKRPWFQFGLQTLSIVLVVASQRAIRTQAADSAAERERVGRRLEKYCEPPAEFAGNFGPYRSPLTFSSGAQAKTRQDWAPRRAEILALWQRRLGPWPPLVERPSVKRLDPGVPSAENPRTGLYKELIESGDDLVDLEALMAPRPVLVSGGVQDPPQNWRALNHLVAVNEVLGFKHRVAMTARPTHVPTAEALELELAFLEYWLKLSDPPGTASGLAGGGSQDSRRAVDLQWAASEPLVGPVDRDGDHFYSVKDPSFVREGDKWHLFCTIRGQKRSHQIEYLSFRDWDHVDQA